MVVLVKRVSLAILADHLVGMEYQDDQASRVKRAITEAPKAIQAYLVCRAHQACQAGQVQKATLGKMH